MLWQPLIKIVNQLLISLKLQKFLWRLQENSTRSFQCIAILYILLLLYAKSTYPEITFLQWLSRSSMLDLTFLFIFILLLLLLSFLFLFLFLEQLGLGSISHAVTSVTSWRRSHKTDHGTGENGVEGTRIKWRHTAWTTHVGLM